MVKGHRNSRKQGDVGLGSAIAYFTAMGNTVCIPLTDSQRYDLIVEHKGKLQRVQVKTTTHKDRSGEYQAMLQTCGGNQSCNTTRPFDKSACDLLFILCEDNSRFLIPTDEIKCRRTINLGDKYIAYRI